VAKAVARRLLSPRLREEIEVYRRLAPGIPELVEVPPGHRVLVLAPHMDDEVIGCGGTLAKHADNGCAITVAVLTDGGLGDPVMEATPMPPTVRAQARRALTELRKEESRAAARCLGVKGLHFLDFPDGELAEAPGAREAVARVVADCGPDVLYAPFVTDRQKDHRATADLVAALAPRWPDLLVLGYEVWSPLHATWMVDITAQSGRKREALDCFTSQLPHNDYRHTALGLNAFRSMYHLAGQGFAEAFFAAPARAYADLVAAARGARGAFRWSLGNE
jgi:LmbE family N-acetylglucosaminyl deacetylase